VLIRGEETISLWDTDAEAMRAGYEKFLGQAFLVHQVQKREHLLRSGPTSRARQVGAGKRCPASPEVGDRVLVQKGIAADQRKTLNDSLGHE